jgi:hypothetical protein
MVRKTAQEAGSFSGLPFFRMYLHRRDQSDQHRLLLDLESAGNVVVYAARGFSEPDELNEAYSSDRAAERSIFIRPSAIGPLTDNQRHWIAFQTDPRLAFQCSEPHRVKFELPAVLFRSQSVTDVNLGRRRPSPESYGEVADELLTIYESRRQPGLFERYRVEDIRKIRERRDAPDFARLLAHTLFQCQLLVLPST